MGTVLFIVIPPFFLSILGLPKIGPSPFSWPHFLYQYIWSHFSVVRSTPQS